MELHHYLQSLIGLKLCYGIKSEGCELYDLGFFVYEEQLPLSKKDWPATAYALHAFCDLKIIGRKKPCSVTICDATTSPKKFSQIISGIIGKTVDRVALSEKNDLWLDLGDDWIVLVTSEDDLESWRLFIPYSGLPHLVASNARLDNDG